MRRLLLLSVLLVGCTSTNTSGISGSVSDIRVPEGFVVTMFTPDVPGARSMTRGEQGTVFVGTRDAGVVYAVTDRDKDGVADEVRTIVEGADTPNGVAFHDGSLYVAELNRVLRYDDIESRLEAPPEPVVIRDDFPTDRHHGWKFLAIGPDDKLYVPVGAPCNVCTRDDERYSSIMRMNLDGSELEVYAAGVRNSVGFAWHPTTNELWFTDNGRDRLGDDEPPDELNHAPQPGMHFGFPFCHGGDFPDPDYGTMRPCDDTVPPAVKLGPHVAALGMRFSQGGPFPAPWDNRIFIAEHGSWNRSKKIGYRVTTVTVSSAGDAASDYQPFAEGWLVGQEAWGRPVDVMFADGALLVSDDFAGAIYRIAWTE